VNGRELATATAKRIAACEARGLHAFLDWSEAKLLAQAERLHPASDALLTGQAVAIKANICDADHESNCGSKILEGWTSPFEATVVKRLREHGAIVAGKTTCDEFAMGSSTEHCAFGPALNPIDPSRVPGGSSGGSAVAVAAGAVDMALGSETGGSVRQPAAFCGIVGIKPTYGRVSRYGLVAFGSSLDQVSPFGKDVRSAALLLSAISGRDERDATTIDRVPLTPPGAAPGSLAGTVIGIPKEYFPEGLHPGVHRACQAAIGRLKALGAELRDVSLPHTKYAIPAYYIIAPAEASSNLARYDGVRYGLRADAPDVRGMFRESRGRGFGAEVRRRVLLGTYVLSAGYYDAYYRQAQRARARIRADFDQVFGSGVHALFTPTTPTPAFRFGENTADPLAMYLSDIFVCTANLAWVPAISLPIGRDEGLPIGGQFIGPDEGEGTIIRLAQALEAATDATAEVR
jgi:aspartyl-tRNA(Asn)/glutamyl-tRNA(Gln) amidotransferase subunit A